LKSLETNSLTDLPKMFDSHNTGEILEIEYSETSGNLKIEWSQIMGNKFTRKCFINCCFLVEFNQSIDAP